MTSRTLIMLPLLMACLITACGDDENPLQSNETFTGRWVTESGIGIKFFWELAETDDSVAGNVYQELTGSVIGPMPIRNATRSGDRIEFSLVDDSAIIVINGQLITLDSLHIEATLANNTLLNMNGTFCLLDTCIADDFPAFRQSVGF